MVYKIVEIKYTVLHVMKSCTKKANVMYTGQGNKEQVSQDLKDRFLIFFYLFYLSKMALLLIYLLIVYLCLFCHFTYCFMIFL